MGKVIKFADNFNTLQIKDKIKSVIELLNENNLKDIIYSLIATLENELDIFSIMSLVCKRKKYKQFYLYTDLE